MDHAAAISVALTLVSMCAECLDNVNSILSGSPLKQLALSENSMHSLRYVMQQFSHLLIIIIIRTRQTSPLACDRVTIGFNLATLTYIPVVRHTVMTFCSAYPRLCYFLFHAEPIICFIRVSVQV